MKSKKYLLMALCLCTSVLGNAQSTKALDLENGIYFDWSGQAPDEMLEAFKTGGTGSLKLMKDIEFKRSHVRVKPVISDQATQLDPLQNPKRSFWFNCPIGATGSPKTGMPSDRFDDDVFSMWQYVKIHGNWSNDWFCAPAAYTDAAHKHGTSVLGTWGIPWAWSYAPGSSKESDYKSWFLDMLTKKDQDGKFIYAEPLINMLMYLGVDGINYNSECNLNSKTADLKALHEELYKIAAQKGFDSFHIGWYDGVNNNGNMQYIDYLGYHNNQWYCNEETNATVSDAFMLNYNWGESKLKSTEQTAKELMTPNGALDVYAGCWIVGLDRQAWYAFDKYKGISLAFWGEHKQNRIFQHRAGLDEKGMQLSYQDRLERIFTGGNKNPNPASRLPISLETNLVDNKLEKFHGVSRFIAERSTVNGSLPFATNFILGNGRFYNENGEKTYGNWYNLSAQDMCPTYRWLVVDNNGNTLTNIAPSYDFAEAWIGGTSLLLKGTANSTPTNVHLYRSDLTVGTNPKLNLVYKTKSVTPGSASNLKFIYQKNNVKEWLVAEVGNVAKTGWNEVNLALPGLAAGDKITAIGVRVQAPSTVNNYEVNIGELKIADDTRKAVNAPVNFAVEYMNETDKHLDAKLFWEMNLAGAENRLIYNDEVNTAYFEVFVKENDVVKQVARTSAWAHFVPQIALTPGVGNVEIGVRAVSTDLTTKSNIVWKNIVRDPNAPIEPEKDKYCVAINDPQSDGIEVAQKNRFVETATTTGAITNLNFNGVATDNGYCAYINTNNAIEAQAGTSFVLNAIASSRQDGMKYCKVTIYGDWNNDGEFDPLTETCDTQGTDRAGDERVAKLVSTIAVPADAVNGITRLRLRYSDAWFPQPGPCGLAQKGYTLDLAVKVTGGTTDLDVVETNAPSFYPNPVVNDVNFQNVEKAVIIDLNGKPVATYSANDNGSARVDLSYLKKGIYLVKMENAGVVKCVKLIKN